MTDHNTHCAWCEQPKQPSEMATKQVCQGCMDATPTAVQIKPTAIFKDGEGIYHATEFVEVSA